MVFSPVLRTRPSNVIFPLDLRPLHSTTVTSGGFFFVSAPATVRTSNAVRMDARGMLLQCIIGGGLRTPAGRGRQDLIYSARTRKGEAMKRIIVGGILAGIAMFMWEGLAHEVLPLGEAGIKGLANEPPILASIKENVKESGFYIFPWMDTTPGLSKDQRMQKT